MTAPKLDDARYVAGLEFKFFSIADVAELIQVAPRTVRRWIKAGDLVAHRVGGVVRIADGDLRTFLARHRGGRRRAI